MSSSFEGVYEPGIVDPGVPVANSTSPFWLSQPHPLADHRSPWPTGAVDVVIIGSGISGTNLARTLLLKRPDLRVVLIDARSLCSGATARNGGHIKTMTFAVWEDRKRAYGIEEAIRISAFEHSHLETMSAAAQEAGIDCDLVKVEGVDAYYDQRSFDKAIKALEDMRTHAPHLANKYKVYTEKDRLHKVMKLSSRCIGAIGVPAASVWPYKFVTGILDNLIRSRNLNVQTHTTVQAVNDDAADEFARVRTNRGSIKARHVIHATNGWMGHLLPELRPFISPVRGNVVHYNAADKNGRSAMSLDSKFSLWLRYAVKDYDYLIQRQGGDVVVGRANTGRRATGDDSETDMSPMAQLRGFSDEAMATPVPGASAHISHVWSGILGFTQDAMPFVGRLPFPGRSRQWVCGGYHGIGMIKAFRTAEMVALMVLDESVSDEYPRSMLITEKRVRDLQRSVEAGNEVVKAKL
ncbi:Fc.00g096360.m01.CDS01 [Cosmosporella sp. VM-42]